MSAQPPVAPALPAAAHGPVTTRPLLGVIGVLFGALMATCAGRLLSVGLVDVRGALHFSVDGASWLTTAFNAAMMFIGPFSVYLGGLLGPRRVLLTCAFAFTLISCAMPFATHLWALLSLLVLAGLTAGTFYPLTLSFVLRNLPMPYVLIGIAMYAADIVFTTNVSTSFEAWLVGHLSWRWIFWTGSVLTPLMMVCIYYGIPPQPLPHPKEGQPRPNWRGFLYASFSFALMYAALDQGQRLNWLHSGTIVGLMAASLFLFLATIVRRLQMPNPLIHLRFLLRRNTLLLGVVLVLFRFAFLGTVLVVPTYLARVQGYLPLQTGPVLLWIALPQLLCGALAMYLMRYVDSRLILTAGFALVGVACLMDARLSSVWAAGNFAASQAVMAIGLALAFNALVGSIVLEVLETGALGRPIDVLTFAGFFQTLRLLGGELGSTFLQHFLALREEFHSNMLGLHVSAGSLATTQRLQTLSAGIAGSSTGLTLIRAKAAWLLGLQLRQQAFTLAITDSFLLVAWSTVVCLVVIACMSRVSTQYAQVIAAPAGLV